MARMFPAIAATLLLISAAAFAQPLLPRCTPALDGVVSAGGCSCSHDPGGQLSAQPPGWRWRCDLLRGPGAEASVPAAGLPAPDLPPGFTYAPQFGRTAY